MGSYTVNAVNFDIAAMDTLSPLHKEILSLLVDTHKSTENRLSGGMDYCDDDEVLRRMMQFKASFYTIDGVRNVDEYIANVSQLIYRMVYLKSDLPVVVDHGDRITINYVFKAKYCSTGVDMLLDIFKPVLRKEQYYYVGATIDEDDGEDKVRLYSVDDGVLDEVVSPVDCFNIDELTASEMDWNTPRRKFEDCVDSNYFGGFVL